MPAATHRTSRRIMHTCIVCMCAHVSALCECKGTAEFVERERERKKSRTQKILRKCERNVQFALTMRTKYIYVYINRTRSVYSLLIFKMNKTFPPRRDFIYMVSNYYCTALKTGKPHHITHSIASTCTHCYMTNVYLWAPVCVCVRVCLRLVARLTPP